MSGKSLEQLERLEPRRMLSVSNLKGTQGDDVVLIGVGDTPMSFFVDLNGKLLTQGTFQASDPDKAIIIDLLAGNDLLTVEPGFPGKLKAIGGAGNDTLIGGNSSLGESLLGSEGNDSLVGGDGKDKLVGGAGNDILHGGKGSDQLFGDGAPGLDDTKNFGKDTLFGDAGDDYLNGGAGNDQLHGGDGDDSLIDGAGDDNMHGDGGNDTLVFDRRDTLNIGGEDLYDGGVGNNTLQVFSTAQVSISLDGVANDGPRHDRANILPNFSTFDLRAFPAKSILDASGATAGVDVLFFGIAPTDQNINNPPGPAVTLIGSAFNDTFSIGGFSNIVPEQIDAGAGDDSIDGSLGPDTLLGGDGNDTIHGFAGADSIDGGAGNDSIDGGTGNDTIYGGDGNDSIQGAGGRDTINGGAGKDTIFGGSGKDTVNGAGGNDLLYGGPNDADHIVGGSGTDSAGKDSKDTYSSVEILLNS
jgi:Ca2+-binding RTX toxin-like protein